MKVLGLDTRVVDMHIEESAHFKNMKRGEDFPCFSFQPDQPEAAQEVAVNELKLVYHEADNGYYVMKHGICGWLHIPDPQDNSKHLTRPTATDTVLSIPYTLRPYRLLNETFKTITVVRRWSNDAGITLTASPGKHMLMPLPLGREELLATDNHEPHEQVAFPGANQLGKGDRTHDDIVFQMATALRWGKVYGGKGVLMGATSGPETPGYQGFTWFKEQPWWRFDRGLLEDAHLDVARMPGSLKALRAALSSAEEYGFRGHLGERAALECWLDTGARLGVHLLPFEADKYESEQAWWREHLRSIPDPLNDIPDGR